MDIADQQKPAFPELWVGVEPTVRRIRDEYLDQLEVGGHARRIADLDLIAALGATRARYPVLWERHAPDGVASADWSWSDGRLARLRELGVAPILGLLHHGSGPRDTSLLDPRFPERLAEYAEAVATRYPWADAYTPVNEPLTTARFSCLYGIWYPHTSDDLSFSRALLNECRAVVLSMRAIRRINPAAQLVQTEDLGRTYSTELLRYQADLENERRWVTHDVLHGRLEPGMPMWEWFLEVGVDRAELEWFRENPCPPDILGINTYVTSERALTENMAAFPGQFHGGNGRHRYADIEAVRVSSLGMSGHHGLLLEAWNRYQRPLALTEVQLAAAREDQVKWVDEAWRSIIALRAEGVDVRAMTAWSLFGAHDWNSLLTKQAGYYESGAFDVRSPAPRWTAVARQLQHLARQRDYEHPVLAVPGWWRRSDRLLYPPVEPVQRDVCPIPLRSDGAPRPVLVTGARGTLGQAFARMAAERGLCVHLTSRSELDIADDVSVRRSLDEVRPWAVVNTAGFVRVDEAETDIAACTRENVNGAAALAGHCAELGIPLVTFSSDLVFDGEKRSAYVESDPTNPLNAYGRTKAEAEEAVLRAHAGALVVRTSAFFGPWDRHNFLFHLLQELGAGRAFPAGDEVVSPTYVPDLVNVCCDLLVDGETGIWHLANAGCVTWFDLATEAARRARLDERLVKRSEPTPGAARRPPYSALTSERGWLMPSLDDALDRFFAEVPPAAAL